MEESVDHGRLGWPLGPPTFDQVPDRVEGVIPGCELHSTDQITICALEPVSGQSGACLALYDGSDDDVVDVRPVGALLLVYADHIRDILVFGLDVGQLDDLVGKGVVGDLAPESGVIGDDRGDVGQRRLDVPI